MHTEPFNLLDVIEPHKKSLRGWVVVIVRKVPVPRWYSRILEMWQDMMSSTLETETAGASFQEIVRLKRSLIFPRLMH